MNKIEFLRMMEQDLVTHPKRNELLPVLECMKEVLKSCPGYTEINHQKTVEGCFNEMREHARKNQTGGCFYFGHTESLKFVEKYLGIKQTVKFDDFMDLEAFL